MSQEQRRPSRCGKRDTEKQRLHQQLSGVVHSPQAAGRSEYLREAMAHAKQRDVVIMVHPRP